ncbi:hypothetical protein VNO78_20977 [Psophocarpus tetragonolobus]|uniref:Uncharacterized protein n=1 Tax=Psophocarpus tetragonolobus TaxID=3891 RepID=A0AAN9SBX3_PSOTE
MTFLMTLSTCFKPFFDFWSYNVPNWMVKFEMRNMASPQMIRLHLQQTDSVVFYNAGTTNAKADSEKAAQTKTMEGVGPSETISANNHFGPQPSTFMEGVSKSNQQLNGEVQTKSQLSTKHHSDRELEISSHKVDEVPSC